MLRLLIDDAIVSAYELFLPLGKPILCPGKQIREQASSADALIIRSRTHIDETLLMANPQLKFIGSSVVGLDHVDQQACTQHEVTFYSAQGCNARSVAEYVISHLVSYVHNQRKDFDQITLGIVGVGQVGKRIAAMAKALGIKLLLNDPPRAETETDFTQTELNTLLAQADIITFHTPLTHEGKYLSHYLLNQANIQRLKPNALVINAARGGIIDESSLLTRDDLSLIIDCWENEPHCNPVLLESSLSATPHIAGHALDAKYRGGQMVAQALADLLKINYHAPNFQASNIPMLTPYTNSNNQGNPIAELAHYLTQTYPFTDDDQMLRNAIHSTEFTQTFEDYRRHYPERYEWHHFTLPDTLYPQTKHWLIELGFSSHSA